MTRTVSRPLEELTTLVSGSVLLAGSSANSTPIVRAVADSRLAGPGDLFVALAADPAKAALHAFDAVGRGASAVAASVRLGVAVPLIVTPCPGRLLALAAEAFEGAPTASLRCIGVTGTNGKTTTTRLVEQALKVLGQRPALIGTGVMRAPGLEEPSLFTTPFGDAISRFARHSVDAGASHLVMEVSSHALEQHRADGVAFEVGAFTNLTRDHLDYHGTMDAYAAAKARLFVDLRPEKAVIHVGDPFGAELATRFRGRSIRVAVEPQDDAEADLVATVPRYGIGGIVARVRWHGLEAELESPLVGRHNLENLLVALGCLISVDVPFDQAVSALASAAGAEGRLERVPHPSIGVFVDYAHTPDAIARVLAALRPSTPGRLLVVFGCGGDRDRGKRPAMAAAASAGADLVVVTSDNPRTEDPNAILDDVLAGLDLARRPLIPVSELRECAAGHVVLVDRREAIASAVAAARPGDTVLIAGKGHEDYQILGTTKHPFDDRVEARRALAARGETV